MKVGVLALQGAFAEQLHALSKLYVECLEVRLPADLNGLDALIIPGGESTTISKLLQSNGLINPLIEKIKRGFPVLGTCAGLILMAREIVDSGGVNGLNMMDIKVRRNAYGRQTDSFEVDLHIPACGKESFHGVFIRAPVIESYSGKIEVLCSLEDRPVAVRQGNLVACSFHPELTGDLRFHRYFLENVREN
jgi:5'-phosphate synthase pdxT subunit